MVILKDKNSNEVFAHFKDDSMGKYFGDVLRVLEAVVLDEKRYMDLATCKLYNSSSIDYIKEAQRIIEDFVYVPELRTQIAELLLAARAKAIQETATSIATKAGHMVREVEFYTVPRSDDDEV